LFVFGVFLNIIFFFKIPRNKIVKELIKALRRKVIKYKMIIPYGTLGMGEFWRGNLSFCFSVTESLLFEVFKLDIRAKYFDLQLS